MVDEDGAVGEGQVEAEVDKVDELAAGAEGVEIAEAGGSPAGAAEPEATVESDIVESEAVGEAVEAELEAEAEPELSPEELEFTDDEIVTDDDLEEDGDEDASPIEEFVEAPVVASDDLEMDWYILKVQVNREKGICEALTRRVKQAGMESYFDDILVPTEDVREFSKSGKQRVVKRKLYPGYIVVRMAINDDTWFLVRETPGIGDFTGAVGKPASLSQQEIDRIMATTRPKVEDEDAADAIKTSIRHKVGDRVRVKEGYFQNYEGDVSKIDERNGRIEVMINIFGRPNPVELDHWQVEDI